MTTNNVKVKEQKWVVTSDGIRMSYEEWREMIEAERN